MTELQLTQSFFLDIEGAEYDALYKQIPEVFVEQARQGYESFFLDKELVSDSTYSGRQVSKTDFFRMVLEEPMETGEGVVFKLRLSGLMDQTTGAMELLKGGQTSSNAEWLNGFRSTLLMLTTEDVENGIISEADYNALRGYADFWQDLTRRQGPGAPYSKDYSRKRIWLVASNPEFSLNFQLEPRLNPQTGESVAGMFDVEWVNAAFIGFGTQTYTRVGKAGSVTATGAVDIPNPRVRPVSIMEGGKWDMVTKGGKSRRGAK